MQKELVDYGKFILVKFVAIFYYSIIYFIFGFISSVLLNMVIPPLYDDNENQTINRGDWLIILEIIMNFGIISIVFFMVRKIVKMLPFPLEGIMGFEKARLRELQGGIIIASIFFNFQPKLLKKLNYIKDKYIFAENKNINIVDTNSNKQIDYSDASEEQHLN